MAFAVTSLKLLNQCFADIPEDDQKLRQYVMALTRFYELRRYISFYLYCIVASTSHTFIQQADHVRHTTPVMSLWSNDCMLYSLFSGHVSYPRLQLKDQRKPAT